MVSRQGSAEGQGARGPAGPAARGPAPDLLAEGALFDCDVWGASPKDDLATMEHPLFSLATRPDLRVMRYARGAARIEVTPSVKGRATIHDKDILIYCTSQIMAAMNAGRPVSKRLRLRASDLLEATGREASGDGYRRLRLALERLAGTRVTTNLAFGPPDPETGARAEITEGFGLIESWRIARRARAAPGAPARMESVTVVLSDWLFGAVAARQVLTLSRDYFSLRKPLERRLYEIARKHCGHQSEWRASVATLHEKSGSASERRVFRKRLRETIAAGTLPDYEMREEPGDLIVFRNRRAGPPAPPLSAEALAAARALMPGTDAHALEARWREYWAASGRPRLGSADAAFLGYVKALREG